MQGVLGQYALRLMLDYLVNRELPQDLVLRLFRSDSFPALGSSVLDFVECDFYGYAPVRLVPGRWQVTPQGISYPGENFVCEQDESEPSPVYGYYVTRTNTGEYIGGGRILPDGPVTLFRFGDYVYVPVNLVLPVSMG